MESQVHPILFATATPSRCPFHDGPATLDALLAELNASREPEALDLALDLRSALTVRRSAEQCVALAIRLRHTLNDRHYLAFYRVRQWLQRVIAVQVREFRGQAWARFPLPLNSARVEEIENACLAAWAQVRPRSCLELAQVRFVFLSETPAAAGVANA
jgi:hypothetical protein